MTTEPTSLLRLVSDWRKHTALRAHHILSAFPFTTEKDPATAALLREEERVCDGPLEGLMGGFSRYGSTENLRALILLQNPFKMPLHPPAENVMHPFNETDRFELWLAHVLSQPEGSERNVDFEQWWSSVESNENPVLKLKGSLRGSLILNAQPYRYYVADGMAARVSYEPVMGRGGAALPSIVDPFTPLLDECLAALIRELAGASHDMRIYLLGGAAKRVWKNAKRGLAAPHPMSLAAWHPAYRGHKWAASRAGIGLSEQLQQYYASSFSIARPKRA